MNDKQSTGKLEFIFALPIFLSAFFTYIKFVYVFLYAVLFFCLIFYHSSFAQQTAWVFVAGIHLLPRVIPWLLIPSIGPFLTKRSWDLGRNLRLTGCALLIGIGDLFLFDVFCQSAFAVANIFGTVALFIGTLMAGVGVIVAAVVALVIHAGWWNLENILLCFAFAVASRKVGKNALALETRLSQKAVEEKLRALGVQSNYGTDKTD